tara:strand:- start:3290 stop:3949 length:660 start_codon:yes stop_codon:yes gene_type:complete
MGLGKLGINGILALGLLACVFSVGTSIASLADIDDSQSEHTYKTTWRLLQVVFRSLITLANIILWGMLTFGNVKSRLKKDFGWRKIIFTTFLWNLSLTVISVLNLIMKYGKGHGIHVVRTVIEIINIASTFLIGFWPFVTKMVAHIKEQSLDDVKEKNPLFKTSLDIQHLDPKTVPNTSFSSGVTSEMKTQAKMINKSAKKDFGKRQRRRNPPKKRKKK